MKTFLTPLSTQEENAYLRRMASGDREAKRKLVEHNMRLVAHVAKKYYNSEDDMEDMISIGTIGLLKAVDTYNPGKGSKLATYAARCIDNELLMYFRGKKKRAKDISIYEPIGTDKEGNQIHLFDVLEEETVDVVEQMEHEKDLATLRRLLPSVLSDREYQIISMRTVSEGTPTLPSGRLPRDWGSPAPMSPASRRRRLASCGRRFLRRMGRRAVGETRKNKNYFFQKDGICVMIIPSFLSLLSFDRFFPFFSAEYARVRSDAIVQYGLYGHDSRH